MILGQESLSHLLDTILILLCQSVIDSSKNEEKESHGEFCEDQVILATSFREAVEALCHRDLQHYQANLRVHLLNRKSLYH